MPHGAALQPAGMRRALPEGALSGHLLRVRVQRGTEVRLKPVPSRLSESLLDRGKDLVDGLLAVDGVQPCVIPLDDRLGQAVVQAKSIPDHVRRVVLPSLRRASL